MPLSPSRPSGWAGPGGISAIMSLSLPPALTAERTPLWAESSSTPPRACHARLSGAQAQAWDQASAPIPAAPAQRNHAGGLVLAGAAVRAAPPSSRGPALTGRMKLCCPGHLQDCRFYPPGFPFSRARGGTGHSFPGVQGLTQAQAGASIGLGTATRALCATLAFLPQLRAAHSHSCPSLPAPWACPELQGQAHRERVWLSGGPGSFHVGLPFPTTLFSPFLINIYFY